MLWEFIELPAFTRRRKEMGLDEQYYALQEELIDNPERGTNIGGCGLRKTRMGAQGRGKRSGVRVMYYYDRESSRIYLLMLFAKNEIDDLTEEQKKILCKVLKEALG